jgi:hypothetical protein
MVYENDPEVKKFMESEGRIYPGNDELDPPTAKQLNDRRAAIERGELPGPEAGLPAELSLSEEKILENWESFKKKHTP